MPAVRAPSTLERRAPGSRTPGFPSYRGPRAGLRELGMFALAYLTYFGIRAATEGHVDIAVANAWRIFDAEGRPHERRQGDVQDRGIERHHQQRHAQHTASATHLRDVGPPARVSLLSSVDAIAGV